MNEHLIITPKTTESYTLVKKKMAEKGAFWLNHPPNPTLKRRGQKKTRHRNRRVNMASMVLLVSGSRRFGCVSLNRVR